MAIERQSPQQVARLSLTKEQLAAAMPGLAKKPALLAEYLPYLNEAMEEAAINTPKRIAAFLSQIGHESLDFKFMKEIWGPTAAQKRYEGRKDLGNTQPGDGHRFMGRGPIQVTGRANYRAAGQALGLDLEDNPEQAATPQVAFRVAGWYWSKNNLNKYADRDQFETLTRRINGGVNGLDDRLARWAVAKRALNSTPAPDAIASEPEGAGAGGAPLTPAPPADTVQNIENAGVVNAPTPIQTVAGGSPTDPGVDSSEGQPFWKRAMKLATGGGISIAAVTGGIQAVTGLSPTAQVIVISAVVIGLVIFVIIGLIYFAADRLLVKYSRSRPDRINVK